MDRISVAEGVMNRSLSLRAFAKSDVAKCGSDRRESHDLLTHLNRTRDFTGNLNKISIINSHGRTALFFATTLLLSPFILGCYF
ncbi:hypothetical protein CR513_40160, partial [Mucuna pruriens]